MLACAGMNGGNTGGDRIGIGGRNGNTDFVLKLIGWAVDVHGQMQRLGRRRAFDFERE
jgi:hypothetical protein